MKQTNVLPISRRAVLKSTLAASTVLATGTYPSLAYAAKPKLINGSLETSLELLNMWGEKPAAINELYAAIYSALAKSPAASFRDVSEDATVQRLCKEQDIVHLGGPMLGCISDNSATVWVRTLKPAGVTVKVSMAGQEKTFGPVQSTFETDLTARVHVKGLPEGKSSIYRVFIDGQEIAASGNATITTTPNPEKTTTRIAFGTCQHRWGLGNEKMTQVILDRKPHAMLMYGDIAVQDRRADLGMHRADYALRDFHPAWNQLVSAVPVYTSWDDHDYYDNDMWGTHPKCTDKDRRGMREVHMRSWSNPACGNAKTGEGIFQHTRIGPCDVIMTDNRYFRQKEGKHCFLGPDQMAWLKKTLLACKGPFIILSCGTMWSDYVSGGKDSWGKFDPEGREEILNLIEEHKIPGVLLISGDRHGARGFTIPRPSGYKFYEFEPASLGGRSGPPSTSDKWETQLYGISGEYAFGEFTFDTSLDDPEVTFRLIGESKETKYKLTLKQSQLTP